MPIADSAVAGNDIATNCSAGAAVASPGVVVALPAPRPRRHWCTRLSFSSNWRATAATDAPGCAQATMTSALSCSLCRRLGFDLTSIDVHQNLDGHHPRPQTAPGSRWEDWTLTALHQRGQAVEALSHVGVARGDPHAGTAGRPIMRDGPARRAPGPAGARRPRRAASRARRRLRSRWRRWIRKAPAL